jgi:excisionase family DNA binding protein
MHESHADWSFERLLSAREVAERIGLREETIRRWARCGRIPSIRATARTIRFDYGDVVAALRAQGASQGEVPRE